MRHRIAGRILGRDAGHRKALFRNLVRELYLHGRITTTDAKARAIRSEAEKLITKAKRGLADGGNRVHAQRQIVSYLNDKTVAKKVFDDLAPRFAERNGGYTRIIKLGKRLGDAAEMSVIELVEGPQGAGDAGTAATRGPATRGPSTRGPAGRGPGGSAPRGPAPRGGSAPRGNATTAPTPRGTPRGTTGRGQSGS